MSSPGGAMYRPAPEQQPIAPQNTVGNDIEEASVIIRQMRLKVLYTFDDQNRTNCLARWPHVLEIQTVAMDETTSIGVVELKACIQAIVQCSPELVAKLGQDYTVYAYDYSEYDNPLVGQGMLSWALAASSSTPDAPASQSKQLVTGRVCKNIMGLFTSGVKETLEVKLRLVPVPTLLQSEYLSSMEKYRELSKIMPPGFDPKEWSAFLQSNPNIAQMASRVSTPTITSGAQRDGMSMEIMNQLLSPSTQQNSVETLNTQDNSEAAASISRTSTPGGRKKANAGKPSRPSSRNSTKRPRAKPRNNSFSAGTSGNFSGSEDAGTDGDDMPEGPSKKRAKIVKADWNSKSSFGSGGDSLRVAASTSASLRLFRPIAAASDGHGRQSHLQDVPRAPTPVPNMPPQGFHSYQRAPSMSSLRQESAMMENRQQRYKSPYAAPSPTLDSQDRPRLSIESAMTSPEQQDSAGETPEDIASSPPVMRAGSLRSSPECPSSPVLPRMPGTDSGYLSGRLDELFEENDDSMRPPDDEDRAIAAQYNSRRRAPRVTKPRPVVHHGYSFSEETPGPPEALPTKILPRTLPKPKAIPAPLNRANSVMSDDGQSLPAPKPVRNNGSALASAPYSESQPTQYPTPQATEPSIGPSSRPGSRSMIRTASCGALTLPSLAASEPGIPHSGLHRSQTWSDAPANVSAPTTGSIPPNPQPVADNPKSGKISQSVQAKKEAIRSRLTAALARGEMPPYCVNCGAIETPTWRKAWQMECLGDPGFHEYSDDPGRVVAIEILERDTMGRPLRHRIIKKSLLPSEDKSVFTEITLCNPCGIWMSKYKSHRPQDKWTYATEAKQPKEKKKRPSKRKNQDGSNAIATSDAYFPQSEAFPQSDAQGPQVTESPVETRDMPPSQMNIAQTPLEQEEPRLPTQRPRASSVRPISRTRPMTSDAASVALKRAIQSSPARWMDGIDGSRYSPIELEEDLGQTRRLLFPSPRKDGSPKILGELQTNTVEPATDFRNPKDGTAEAQNKENCPPFYEGCDDELLRLFEEEIARPTTPVQKSPKRDENLFKTPTRPTPSHRPITRSQSRSAKSSNKIMAINRTPSKTPISQLRRSTRNQTVSPFTASLNKLLSEVNNEVPASPTNGGLLHTDLDFPSMLPPNSSFGGNMGNIFENEDFFSTDVPMPSSPPTMGMHMPMFNLYEDSMDSMHGLWGEIDAPKTEPKDMESGFVVDENERASFIPNRMDGAAS